MGGVGDGGILRMRRDRAGKRGRWLSLLVAGFIGYLAGNWHAATVRTTDVTPSQSVALRFPEAIKAADAAVAEEAADAPTGGVSVAVMKNAQLALLSPEPMVPVVPPQQAVMPASSASAAAPQAQSETPTETRTEIKPAAVAPRLAAKPAGAARDPRHAGRQGYMLNDAQIASIKERLHLTPDQERMWPAVEAALRNVAYAKARAEHRPGAPASTEVAALDADSAELQGLKSAAMPLLMSFNDEQKNEVRSLAHVMGLDKLAAEF
jgi:hypothetical protein